MHYNYVVNNMKTVLCYGDSNTYGYNPENGLRYPKEIRWTTILQDLLGGGYEVIVEGLNGRTTAYDRADGAFKNGLTPLTAILGSHKPLDYIIFMLGTNDCNKDLDLSSNDIKDGMEKLIKETIYDMSFMQDYMPIIIIVVPARIKDEYKISPFQDQLNEESVNKSKALASLYKELAYKYNLEYLDGTDILEVSSIDSEHLTVKGHNKLAHLLKEIIN